MNYVIGRVYVIAAGLGVNQVQDGTLDEQIFADIDSRAFSGIAGSFLEGSTEDGKLLSFQVVVKLFVNSTEEHFLAVVIHTNDGIPVIGNFSKTLELGQVDQSKDVLLEAAASPTNTAIQEFISNSSVRGNTFSDFVDIGVILLAHESDTVN